MMRSQRVDAFRAGAAAENGADAVPGRWSLGRGARHDRVSERGGLVTPADDSERLAARLRRFSETQEPFVVLDPAALDEASRLWDAAMAEAGAPQMVSADSLTTLGYLHLFRYQVLPEGQNQDDLRKTLRLFGLLGHRAPELIPDQVADLFVSVGIKAFQEHMQSGRPELLDAAVGAHRVAVAATPADHPYRA